MEAIIGKKSGPAPPPAPDPVATAAAQATANKEGAIAQANLNRIDQYTPQGSITYQQTGTNADGTPKYQQTQAYSPDQQQIYQQETAVDKNLNGLALNNISRVNDAQSKPFSYDDMVPMLTSVGSNIPGMQYGTQTPGVARGPMPSGQVQSSIGATPEVKQGFQGAGPLATNVNAGPIQDNIAGAGDVSRVGQQGMNIQGGLDYSGATKLPGTDDFSADAKRVQDSVYSQAASRLDPQYQQQGSDLESRLANQGIAKGSDAYNRELDNMNRAKTDAYNQANYSAIQAGSNEQSRLFGLAQSARQQGVNETNAQGQFANAAQGQIFGQNAQAVGVNNAAQGQQFGQNAQQAGFQNSAQQQGFQQGQTNAALNNSAQAQQFGQNQSQAEFGNNAAGQIFGQSQDRANFGNSAQAQQYTQNLSDAQMYNDSGQQQFGMQQANAALNNTARGQAFNEDVTNANFQNSARQQQIQEATYLRNLPLNEIASLLGTGGGVQNPTFQNVSQVGVAPADYQGAVYNSYTGQMNAWQQQMQNRGGALGSIFGALGSLGAGAASGGISFSDRRVKRDVVEVGALANGIPTYAFKYLWSDAPQFGVMAQDVMGVLPDAVLLNDNGYMMVDYGKVYG